MKYDLSILCPAIRSDRWPAVYKSIEESFMSGTWELVLVTERALPEKLKDKPNIKVIFSERSPMAKQQEGLSHCEGQYITVMSDDSVWLPGTLDRAMEIIKPIQDYKTILILKYLEGIEHDYPEWYLEQVPRDMRFKTNWDFMRDDKYYWSDSHESSSMIGIPYHSPILSCAIYNRKLLFEIGGWRGDLFQSQALGNVEAAARMMWYGCKYIITPFVVSQCGYMEAATGDHGPIHHAQLESDQPKLNEYFRDDRHKDKIVVPIDNWRLSEAVWHRKKG